MKGTWKSPALLSLAFLFFFVFLFSLLFFFRLRLLRERIEILGGGRTKYHPNRAGVLILANGNHDASSCPPTGGGADPVPRIT